MRSGFFICKIPLISRIIVFVTGYWLRYLMRLLETLKRKNDLCTYFK